MSCSGFQQFRVAELLQVSWSGEDLISGAFDLSSALDVGAFRHLAVSVTVSRLTLGTNVTGVVLNGTTAAINQAPYYSTVPESITLDEAVTSKPLTWVGSFEMLSRFWLPSWSLATSGTASGGTTAYLTVDVVARS